MRLKVDTTRYKDNKFSTVFSEININSQKYIKMDKHYEFKTNIHKKFLYSILISLFLAFFFLLDFTHC